MRIFLVLFIVMTISTFAGAAEVTVGQRLVEANCSRCHAIGLKGASPLAKAPPFREVVKRYPVENLEEALVEGIVTGHNEMPEFTFDPDQALAIIAYLNSLKVAK